MEGATIAVMGATGTGKTTFINVASGSTFPMGAGLRSCTDHIQESDPFHLDGRNVTLVDTPGFDDTTKSDVDILLEISNYLAESYEEGKKLSGVIYIHRISDFRVGGVSRRNFKMFREICGQETLANVIILTNMWSQVSPQVGEERETELATGSQFFEPALRKGARMMRHDGSCDSAHNVLRHMINNQPLSLQIQREIVEQKKNIAETTAGTELREDILLEEQQRNEEEMKRLQRETEDAIKAREEEARRIIDEEAKRQEEAIQEAEARAQALAAEFERNRKEKEREEHEAAERTRQEAEQAAAQQRQQAEELQREIERIENERRALEEEHRVAQERWAAEESRRHNPFEQFGRDVDEGFKWFGAQIGHTFGWW